MTPGGSNVYTNPNMEIITPSINVIDLGIYMSGDCTFNYHISSLSKKLANWSGWILRTFYSRELYHNVNPCLNQLCSHGWITALSYGRHQTYNSTRENTTVFHQTYYRDE